MTMCLIFVEEIIRVICVHASQNGKPYIQKDKFYDKLVYVWVMKGTKELTLGIGDFMFISVNVHVGKNVNRFEVYIEETELESEIWKVEYCWNSAIRRIYVWQIHGLRKREKGNLQFRW